MSQNQNLAVFANNISAANSTGLYYSGSVNATSYNTGVIGTGTGGSVQNTTIVFIGNNTVNAYLNTTGLNINAVTIANTTGVYTGVVNGSTISVGSSITANSSKLVIGTAVAVQANGGLGTSGQALTSNGTGVYWSTIVGTNTAASYTWTNTHTFNANVTIGTTAGLNANGSVGTSGQVLTSNGSSVYWATATTDPTPTVFLLMGA